MYKPGQIWTRKTEGINVDGRWAFLSAMPVVKHHALDRVGKEVDDRIVEGEVKDVEGVGAEGRRYAHNYLF